MSSGWAISSACDVSGPPSRERPIAGRARLPTITGGPNSTATGRTSPPGGGRDPPRAGAPAGAGRGREAEGDQTPPACEPLRHPVTAVSDLLRPRLEER